MALGRVPFKYGYAENKKFVIKYSYVFSCILHISIISNVKFTVDEVQLLLSLEFRQNAVDFVSFTPVGRPILNEYTTTD